MTELGDGKDHHDIFWLCLISLPFLSRSHPLQWNLGELAFAILGYRLHLTSLNIAQAKVESRALTAIFIPWPQYPLLHMESWWSDRYAVTKPQTPGVWWFTLSSRHWVVCPPPSPITSSPCANTLQFDQIRPMILLKQNLCFASTADLRNWWFPPGQRPNSR